VSAKKVVSAIAIASLVTAGVLGSSPSGKSGSTIAYADDNDCDSQDQQCNDLANCNCDAYYQECLDDTATRMANYYTFGCRGLSHDACVQVIKQKGLCNSAAQTCVQFCNR
jgi:hypothetical protein